MDELQPPVQAYGEKLGAEKIEDLVVFLRSKPLAPGEVAPVDLEALKKLPPVINPKGKPPAFTLRADRFVSVDQVKAALAKKNRMVIGMRVRHRTSFARTSLERSRTAITTARASIASPTTVRG